MKLYTVHLWLDSKYFQLHYFVSFLRVYILNMSLDIKHVLESANILYVMASWDIIMFKFKTCIYKYVW